MRQKKILYLNYSPYENSGHILDFLVENFETVYLFSLAHHSLGRKKPANKLTTYKSGRMIYEKYLYYMNIPDSLIVFLLPVRSVFNAFQIIFEIIRLSRSSGKIEYYFTVNAFTAAVGRLLKRLGIVGTTVFWVWDYYPPQFQTFSGRFMRRIYWEFDKFATYSDRVFYLNHRMFDVRKDKGVIPKTKRCIEVPIGTSLSLPVRNKNLNNIKLGFIGVMKKSQGIDMLLDAQKGLKKSFKKITFELLGSGPDEKMFKRKAKRTGSVKYNFYGYVDEKTFKKVLYGSTIGVSPYMPEPGNVSKYTDPGKPKRYLEFNLPVITTDVIEFAQEIKKYKAGEVIPYGDIQAFTKAIIKISNNYPQYVKGAIKLNKKYFYKNLYPVMFK